MRKSAPGKSAPRETGTWFSERCDTTTVAQWVARTAPERLSKVEMMDDGWLAGLETDIKVCVIILGDGRILRTLSRKDERMKPP